jgi:hypothetical protein
MEPPKLKLFSPTNGPNSELKSSSKTSSSAESKTVKDPTMLPVAVRDLVPLLVDAFQTDRTWLKDFGRENIHVSADLYEILLAYQQLRRYDAA